MTVKQCYYVYYLILDPTPRSSLVNRVTDFSSDIKSMTDSKTKKEK